MKTKQDLKKCRFSRIVVLYQSDESLLKIINAIDALAYENRIPVSYVRERDELERSVIDLNTLFIMAGPLPCGMPLRSLAALLTRIENGAYRERKKALPGGKGQVYREYIPKLVITSMDHSFVKSYFAEYTGSSFIDTQVHSDEEICGLIPKAFSYMNRSMQFIDPSWRPVLDCRSILLERVLPSLDENVCCGFYYKALTVSIGKNLGSNDHLTVLMQMFSDEDKKPENCLRYIRHIDAAVWCAWADIVRTREICPVQCRA